jgi:hypothetical protein
MEQVKEEQVLRLGCDQTLPRKPRLEREGCWANRTSHNMKKSLLGTFKEVMVEDHGLLGRDR